MPGSLNGQTVAVTGAAGFLGGRLVHRLADEGCTIIRLARSPQQPLDRASAARVIDIAGDARDAGVWKRLVAADVIFHLAAQTSVAAGEADPDADFDSNVTPMRHLVAACREAQCRPLVLFAGTVTQAGVPARLPVDEEAPDHPITIYDRHKLMAENELKDAAAAGVTRGATLRLSNVYGPGAHGRRADRDVLNRMISAAINGQPLTIHGSGDHVRDYVFVDDVVEAFVVAALHGDGVNSRHFVIGSGRGTSIRDAFALIAARVERSSGRSVAVTTTRPAVALSPIEQRHFVADHSRFSALTGWRPAVDLVDGIDRTIEALTCA